MNKIIVMSDSTCDLGEELITKHDIKIVPLHVSFPKEQIDYLDGVTITAEDVYKKAEEFGETPKTGARNINEFIEDFTPLINEGYDIIYTGIGSGLSSTYNNACIAAKEFPEGRIEIVDSQNLSTGIGLLVLKMAKFRDEGMGVKEIAEKVRELVPQVSAKFCIDRLDYLHKGGRCNGMTKIVAHFLHIHPVAKVINNKLTVFRMPRGKYRKAVDEQIKMFLEDLPYLDKSCVFVTDSGHMDGEDLYVIEELKKYIEPGNIHHTIAGCVISSHCGPKTIGILYIGEKPKEK